MKMKFWWKVLERRMGALEGSNSGRTIEEVAKCEGAIGMSIVHGELGPLVEVLEGSMDGKDRKGYKSDHKDVLNLNAKSEEEGEVPPHPWEPERDHGGSDRQEKIQKNQEKCST